MNVLLLALIMISEPFNLEPRSAETRKWITFLEVERADQTRAALLNARLYVPTFKRIFKQEGVPQDLVWLALIESGFRVDPTSPTKAQGMFQFKKDTARAFGLKVTRRVDQRNNPYLAARTAARYLDYLYKKFGTWELVLAAYNLGEGDLRRAMKRHGARTWLQVKPHVRKDTQEYVGKVKASAVVGNRYLRQFGLENPEKLKTYLVRKGDTLYSIARSLRVDLEQFKALNGLRDNHIYPGQVLLIPET